MSKIDNSRTGGRLGRALVSAGLMAVVMGTALSLIAGPPNGLAADNSARAGGGKALDAGGPRTSFARQPITATPGITPTPGITATPGITLTPGITATAVLTTATPTDTATDVPTATPSATPRPTLPPQPAFLPVTVRDAKCVPFERHSDIVFMLDVSRYMQQEVEGRRSEAWAKDWMRDTVNRIDMTHSKLAIVQFNRDVHAIQHLTNDRALMLAAINRKPERENSSTRMDIAFRVSRDLLLSDEATPGNSKVIFFISLMQAKDIPWDHVPGCDERYGYECAALAAATEVKNGPGGITIYALATSWYGNGLLKGAASDPDKVYLLPGPAEWDKIVGEVESFRRCSFWPRASP